MPNIAYNLNFKSIGNNVTIYDSAKIINPQVISIGNHVIIDDFVFMYSEEINLQNYIHIAGHSLISGGGILNMEEFTGISGGCKIYTGSDYYTGECMTNPTVPYPYRVPMRSFVTFKKHALIGAGSVVLPGVTIGEGATIGAMSLVTKDVEPWTINVGSPSRPIKVRPKERILELEKRLKEELSKGRLI